MLWKNILYSLIARLAANLRRSPNLWFGTRALCKNAPRALRLVSVYCVLWKNIVGIFVLKKEIIRQRSTLPGSHPPSTIDAIELNFCVRYGNRWILNAITTGFFSLFWRSAPSKLNNAWCVFLSPILLGQALGLLVSISFICYHTSTFDLSTG